MRQKTLTIAISAMLLAFLAALPVLRAGFIGQDYYVQLEQLPRLQSPSDAFRKLPPTQGSPPYAYRPLDNLVLMAEERLNAKAEVPANSADGDNMRVAEERAGLPHFLTLIAHLLATGGVALFAAACFRRIEGSTGMGAWAAALTFAVNPVHAEVIGSAYARSTSLAVFLLLASLTLVFAAEEKRSGRLLYLAAGVFFLALLAQEIALAGLILLPLCLYFFPERGEGRSWGPVPTRPLVFFASAAMLYLAMRLVSGVGFPPPPNLSAIGGNVASKQLHAGLYYISRIIYPWPPATVAPTPPGTLEALFIFFALLALTSAAGYMLFRGYRLYLFSLAWFLLACAPAIYLFDRGLIQWGVSDRLLYLPSVGLSLAVGAACDRFGSGRWRKAAIAGLTALLAVYAGATWWTTANVWRSDVAFLSFATRSEPGKRSALPWTKLGYCHLRDGRLDEAEHSFQGALAENLVEDLDMQPDALFGLGEVARRRATEMAAAGRPPEAHAFLKEAAHYYDRAIGLDALRWEYWRELARADLDLFQAERELTGKRNGTYLENARREIMEAGKLAPSDPELAALALKYQELLREN